MTEPFYMKDYGHDPTRFGGTIYLSDFETDYIGKNNAHGSNIAKRIISDWNFDKLCRKNIENKSKAYKF